MPDGQIPSYPQRRRTASPPANPSRLANEIAFDPVLDLQTTTALEYLTAPNPASSLTMRTVDAVRGQNRHFWFDVRQVRAWSDFNVNTISSVPELLRLLNMDVANRYLPVPTKVNTCPETPAQLADACAKHHAVKVNAALKLTQGNERHMAMRTLITAPGARQQPEFVSNYQSDAEKTIYGDGRGRVVGVVKCYDRWNSGMRNGSPADQVKYLQGLAHLHYFMREHGTRYGFIMTEIELICVRAGGPLHHDIDPNIPDNVPLFGYLEVAAPIQIATSGRDKDGSLKMTAGLALWWIHMLASREHGDSSFAGQYHWRMDVGGAAARTRQYHLARDAWMPKLTGSEKRDAKRVRGWFMPDEPLCAKKECGRGRKKAQI
ncbi:sialidase [Teratosphaeria destructans]|uniref:Sialidase n=1 Tax=Teratosphaeria destructans TaxID=418781 RepID=A0A9W7VYQ8_9PEZI|nr:sialidase [Teratosphaeria destructans]